MAFSLGSPVRDLLKQNRLDEALALCRQYEMLNANDRDNAFACAWVYFRTDRAADASRILNKYSRYATLPEYQLLSAYRAAADKQFEEARQLADSVATAQKGTQIGTTALELEGQFLEMGGKLDPAAFLYVGIVNDDPNRGWAQWGLGRYYLERGDVRRAIDHLEATTRLWPRHIGSRFDLAVIYLNQGSPDSLGEAAHWLAECYKLNHADVGVLEQLGVYFEKEGKIPQALKYWQRALQLKKDSSLAKQKVNQYFGDLIDNLIANQHFEEALEKLNQAGPQITSQPSYLYRRGVIYRNLPHPDYNKAAADLTAYLNTKPRDPNALRELGICYLNLKLIDQANEKFTKAVYEDPTNGMNHAWLAFGMEAKGEWLRARDQWQKAVDLLRDPAQLERATRRLATIQKKLNRENNDQ